MKIRVLSHASFQNLEKETNPTVGTHGDWSTLEDRDYQSSAAAILSAYCFRYPRNYWIRCSQKRKRKQKGLFRRHVQMRRCTLLFQYCLPRGYLHRADNRIFLDTCRKIWRQFVCIDWNCSTLLEIHSSEEIRRYTRSHFDACQVRCAVLKTLWEQALSDAETISRDGPSDPDSGFGVGHRRFWAWTLYFLLFLIVPSGSFDAFGPG